MNSSNQTFNQYLHHSDDEDRTQSLPLLFTMAEQEDDISSPINQNDYVLVPLWKIQEAVRHADAIKLLLQHCSQNAGPSVVKGGSGGSDQLPKYNGLRHAEKVDVSTQTEPHKPSPTKTSKVRMNNGSLTTSTSFIESFPPNSGGSVLTGGSLTLARKRSDVVDLTADEE